ncbi:hypothetical protein [Kribbella yunnanensis]|uniref:hypothetical protein n=1 Tax=Kribbella yunnanensis TaxID=190194 RepID=UPI0031CE8537
MSTATLDEFDLDIRLEVIDSQRIGTPMMATSRPWSEPCCSHSCPIECKPSVDC